MVQGANVTRVHKIDVFDCSGTWPGLPAHVAGICPVCSQTLRALGLFHYEPDLDGCYGPGLMRLT